MKRSLVTTSILWALPVGLAAAAALPLVGELFYQPSDGVTLEHSIEIYLSADLDDFEMTAMGQTMGPDEMGDFGEMAGEVELTLLAVDEIDTAERGRTLSMVRTYEEMTVDGEVPEGADEGPRQVRFTWNEDAGSHDIEVLDEDADDEDRELASAMLSEDMSLRMLLPTGEVAEGDSWTVEAGAEGMLSMFFPGIRLDGASEFLAAAAAEEEPESEEFVREAAELLLQAFEDATMDLTFAGMVEEGDKEFARIDMSTEFLASFDPSDMIERASAMQEDAPEMDATIGVVLSGAGEGYVLWDVEANHLHSMELEGDWTFDVEADISMIMEGLGEIPMDGVASWSGTFVSRHDVTAQE